MKNLFVLVALVLSAATSFADQGQFPTTPDQNITPGVLCTTPDSHRYAEQINYCERNVDVQTKIGRFQAYDQLGYHTQQMNRMDFKIDHYIPLCMGGANDPKNLWPQHKTVYVITDPLEELLCQKMAEGRLAQKDAVRIIMQAKHNLDQVPEIIRRASAL